MFARPGDGGNLLPVVDFGPPHAGPPNAEAATGDPPDGGPLMIDDVSTLPPPTVMNLMWCALHARAPDRYFSHGGRLVQRNGDRIEGVTVAALAGPIARAVAFRTVDDSTGAEQFAAPSAEWRTRLVSDAEHGCRPLTGILRAPALGPNGLIYNPGYDDATGLWLHWEGPPPDPSAVTDEQLVDVLGRLLDFPFVSHSDIFAALGAYVEPLVRPAIDGATPLWVIWAEQEGAGKTYLAKCIGAVATGRMPDERGLDSWSAEASRQLAAYLLAAPSFLLLDNLPTRSLVGGSDLHRYLTAEGPVGIRPMGSSVERLVTIRTTWVTTANLPDLDPEQARRTVQIRLRKEAKRKHRTPELPRWILKNRTLVVSVLLRLVVDWMAAGRPEPRRALPSFEAWSRVVGGILSMHPAVAEHWLSPEHRPTPKLYVDLAKLFADWPTGVNLAEWATKIGVALPDFGLLEYGPIPLNAGQLYELVKIRDLPALLDAISASSVHGTITKLGKLMRSLVEERRVIGGYIMTLKPDKNGVRYFPEPAGPSGGP